MQPAQSEVHQEPHGLHGDRRRHHEEPRGERQEGLLHAVSAAVHRLRSVVPVDLRRRTLLLLPAPDRVPQPSGGAGHRGAVLLPAAPDEGRLIQGGVEETGQGAAGRPDHLRHRPYRRAVVTGPLLGALRG